MRNSSSCDAEQFHSDVNLKAVDRRTTNNSKNWQWKSEGDVSVRRSTPARHGVQLPPGSLQHVGLLLLATGVMMSTSSIRRRLPHRGLRARVPLYRISPSDKLFIS